MTKLLPILRPLATRFLCEYMKKLTKILKSIIKEGGDILSAGPGRPEGPSASNQHHFHKHPKSDRGIDYYHRFNSSSKWPYDEDVDADLDVSIEESIIIDESFFVDFISDKIFKNLFESIGVENKDKLMSKGVLNNLFFNGVISVHPKLKKDKNSTHGFSKRDEKMDDHEKKILTLEIDEFFNSISKSLNERVAPRFQEISFQFIVSLILNSEEKVFSEWERYKDFNHICELIELFFQYRHIIDNKDLKSYKSISELGTAIDNAIEKHENQQSELSNSQKLKAYKKKAEYTKYKSITFVSESEDVQEGFGGQWEVYVPENVYASCLLGANTKWCTAALDLNINMFEHYPNLVIFINKSTGKKLQASIDEEKSIRRGKIVARQFMDEQDHGIEQAAEDTFLRLLPQARIPFVDNLINEIDKRKMFAPIIEDFFDNVIKKKNYENIKEEFFHILDLDVFQDFKQKDLIFNAPDIIWKIVELIIKFDEKGKNKSAEMLVKLNVSDEAFESIDILLGVFDLFFRKLYELTPALEHERVLIFSLGENLLKKARIANPIFLKKIIKKLYDEIILFLDLLEKHEEYKKMYQEFSDEARLNSRDSLLWSKAINKRDAISWEMIRSEREIVRAGHRLKMKISNFFYVFYRITDDMETVSISDLGEPYMSMFRSLDKFNNDHDRFAHRSAEENRLFLGIEPKISIKEFFKFTQSREDGAMGMGSGITQGSGAPRSYGRNIEKFGKRINPTDELPEIYDNEEKLQMLDDKESSRPMSIAEFVTRSKDRVGDMGYVMDRENPFSSGEVGNRNPWTEEQDGDETEDLRFLDEYADSAYSKYMAATKATRNDEDLRFFDRIEEEESMNEVNNVKNRTRKS